VVNATPPGKNRYALCRGPGWAPGPVGAGAENLPLTGIRSPDRPDRRLVAVIRRRRTALVIRKPPEETFPSEHNVVSRNNTTQNTTHTSVFPTFCLSIGQNVSNTTIQCYETILYCVSRATCFDCTRVIIRPSRHRSMQCMNNAFWDPQRSQYTE
jgi:hypothetical protein